MNVPTHNLRFQRRLIPTNSPDIYETTYVLQEYQSEYGDREDEWAWVDVPYVDEQGAEIKVVLL